MTTEPVSPEHQAISTLLQQLTRQLQSVVIGQTRVIDEVLTALIASGHILLEGVPGVGKTLLARAVAQSFGGQFARIQFTPDLMPADVTGHMLYDMREERFQLHKGPVFTHLLLADEINRAPAKTQAALLEVMQEGQVTLEGDTLAVPRPFICIATQNPLDSEGTYPLPDAQTDRFLMKTPMGYPDAEAEFRIVRQQTTNRVADQLDISSLSPLLTPDTLSRVQQFAARTTVDDSLVSYAVDLCRATRQLNGIARGAGPRGSLALIRAGKARALLQGRTYLLPDDLQAIAPAVLRHRLQLLNDYTLDGYDADTLLAEVVRSTPVPRR